MLTRAEVAARYPDSFRGGRQWNKAVAEKVLLDIKEIFDSRGIKFWLMFGTFLGAYRSGDLIPWDEDIDLGVYHEDDELITACSDLFAKKGLLYAPEPDGVLCRENEHADLCSFQLEGDKRVSYPPPNAPAAPYRIDATAFEPPNWVNLLGQKWLILNEPEKWLYHIYGPTWRTPDISQGKRFHGDGRRSWPVLRGKGKYE